jgi:hypothetical protein
MGKDVEFVARMDNGSVVWEDEHGNPAKDHKVHVAKGAAPLKINFKLKDKTKLGLRFDCSMPLQLWEQDGCPPAGIDSDQVQVLACDRDKVTIVDLNTGAARELHYQLNFVGSDGSKHACDPIVDNGGGGPGQNFA